MNSSSYRLDANSVDNQDTRVKILQSAFHEIYKRGFQAASISNILQNTGITKGALYHHFESKAELGYAVLDEVIYYSIFSRWLEPLNDSDDPITTLKDMILHLGSLMTEKDVSLGCPLNNLAQEMSPIDEGFKDRITGIYNEWQNAIEDSFERGKMAGNVDKKVNSKDTALLFIASLQGCMGFAKSVQKLDALIICANGLIERLESSRPLK